MTDRDIERRRKVMEITDWPLADEIYSADLLDVALFQAQMVVRQRANELHDPSCAYMQYVNRQKGSGVAYEYQHCDCWLSRCVLSRCGEPGAMSEPERVQRYSGFVQHASEEEGGEWHTRRPLPIERECPRCGAFYQICEKGHCMVCGTEARPLWTEESP